MYVYFACMYEFKPHVCLVLRSQKRALDPLELELWVVVRHIWVLGIRPCSSTEQPMLFTTYTMIFVSWMKFFSLLWCAGGLGIELKAFLNSLSHIQWPLLMGRGSPSLCAVGLQMENLLQPMAFERLHQVRHGLGNQKNACLLACSLSSSLSHLNSGFNSYSWFIQRPGIYEFPPNKETLIIPHSELVRDFFICIVLQSSVLQLELNCGLTCSNTTQTLL